MEAVAGGIFRATDELCIEVVHVFVHVNKTKLLKFCQPPFTRLDGLMKVNTVMNVIHRCDTHDPKPTWFKMFPDIVSDLFERGFGDVLDHFPTGYKIKLD